MKSFKLFICHFLIVCLLSDPKLVYHCICVSDPNFDMSQASVSINAVGTALKQFFSGLREPVIPQSFYTSLQDAVSEYCSVGPFKNGRLTCSAIYRDVDFDITGNCKDWSQIKLKPGKLPHVTVPGTCLRVVL